MRPTTLTVIQHPNLGIDPSVAQTTAWSNPLITHELHYSHVNTIVDMCAKRAEFEFALMVPKSGANNLPRAQGSASHYIIEHLVGGLQGTHERNYQKHVDYAFKTYIEPNLDAADDVLAEQDKMERNSITALQWLNQNTDIMQLQLEKPFRIAPASDVISGVPDNWSLAGSMDLIQYDHNKSHAKIWDMKFRARSNQANNLNSSQPYMYSLANQFHGYTTEFSFVEIINGKVIEQKIEITPGGMEFFSDKVRQAIRVLEEMWFPMSPSGWWCSPKYCDFWKSCRGRFEP